MKKLGLLLFVTALTVGLLAAANCRVGNVDVKNIGSVRGSGSTKQETRNVTGFKEIEADGAINAEVSVGSAFNVVVEADDNLLPHVKTETSGDTLKVYIADRISSATKINVKISMPELERFEINGASVANVSGVTGDSLEIKVNGASKVSVAGTIKDLNAEANGASSIDAENLKAETADVDASGASRITVSVLDELKAEASGASSISYTGDPKNLKQDASGGSSINKK